MLVVNDLDPLSRTSWQGWSRGYTIVLVDRLAVTAVAIRIRRSACSDFSASNRAIQKLSMCEIDLKVTNVRGDW